MADLEGLDAHPEPRLKIRFRSLQGLLNANFLLKGIALAFLLQVVGTGLKYLLQVILARWLGTAEFGVYSYVYTWVALLAVVASLGFSSSALRFVPEYNAHQSWGLLNGYLARSSQIVFASASATALAAAALAWWFGPAETRPAIAAAVLVLPLLALAQQQSQMLRGLKDILLAFGPLRILQPVLAFLAVALFHAAGWISSAGALLAIAVSMALIILVHHLSLGRIVPQAARSAAPEFATRVWLRISAPMMVTAIAYAFITQIDVVMVGFFLPLEQVGIYSAAGRTAILVSFILVSINSIVAPHISELYALKKIHKLRLLARTATLWMFFPVLAVTIFLILLGKPILNFFGADFVQGYGPLMVLVVGQLVNALTGPVGFITELTGHQTYIAKIYLVSALISTLLNLVLIPRFGLMGAAFATTASVTVSNLWLYGFVYTRILKIDPAR